MISYDNFCNMNSITYPAFHKSLPVSVLPFRFPFQVSNVHGKSEHGEHSVKQKFTMKVTKRARWRNVWIRLLACSPGIGRAKLIVFVRIREKQRCHILSCSQSFRVIASTSKFLSALVSRGAVGLSAKSILLERALSCRSRCDRCYPEQTSFDGSRDWLFMGNLGRLDRSVTRLTVVIVSGVIIRLW